MKQIDLIDSRMMATLEAGGYFSSTCTIRTRSYDNQDQSGQVRHDNYVNVEGLVNLKCRKAPIILMRPTGGEQRTRNMTKTPNTFQVLIPRYLPAIEPRMVAVIDDKAYNILSAECDGSKLLTRMKIEEFIPYGD